VIDPTFSDVDLRGTFEDAGYRYGRACAHLLERARVSAYLAELMPIVRTNPEHLAACAERWAGTLPAHYQLQLEAMASGAKVPGTLVRQWIYADIAAPAPAHVSAGDLSQPGAGRGPEMGPEVGPEMGPEVGAGSGAESALGIGPGSSLGNGTGSVAEVGRERGAASQSPARLIGEGGPLCSSAVVWDRPGEPVVARNCDWHTATLWRGTCVARHAVPGRIPIAAFGIMGDIDCDTGMNVEGLWLHMHTLLAHDEPRAGVSCISWLFWMREALETCASINEVEAFIARTDRDRGVMLIAAEGRGRGRAALFECTRSTYRRIDPWDEPRGASPRLVVTNHCRGKHPRGAELAERPQRPGSTVTRYARLDELLDVAPPEPGHADHDLQELLADPLVEMRETCMSRSLRTIYSAVASPARGEVWFASGRVPAASAGQWRLVRC